MLPEKKVKIVEIVRASKSEDLLIIETKIGITMKTDRIMRIKPTKLKIVLNFILSLPESRS